ncbi:MAG: nodulation protein NfeD [Dehalococcoidia bacterium]
MLRIGFRVFFLSLLVLSVVAGLGGSIIAAANQNAVHILTVDGIIVPVVADYIDRGISDAEERNASVCIIKLNTPGGLLDTTANIVERILNADVPVVVYVSPRGAWAASAGTFITLSAHIAAMAPGTTIGAATPVASGELSEEEKRKITEFTAKWMETIAEERGRNMEEARLAVTQSKSFSYTEALEDNLIDLRAETLDDLITRINGWQIVLASGEQVIIDTTDYVPVEDEMNAVERFLHTISDPNIAYILFSLATVGLMVEISNPGLVFPGVAGGISLLLAFYSLGVLEAYWGGIALIVLAMGLFIAEYFTETFGLLTTGGVIALVMGSLILFTHQPGIEVHPGLIAGVAVGFTSFSIFIIGAIVRGQRRRKATGAEGMIGSTAVARTPLDPTGTVLIQGELWAAVSDGGTMAPGEEVVVTRVEELKLRVAKKTKE